MRTWLAVIALVGAAGCKGDRGTGGQGSGSGSGTGSPAAAGAQTYRDAVGVLCGEGVPPPALAGVDPAERDGELGRWLDQRITNPEARAFVSALADVRDREAQVRRAAATAGITDCRPLAMFAVRTVGGATVPDITTVAGTVELSQDLLVVVVGPSAIEVEGKPVAAVADGSKAFANLSHVLAGVLVVEGGVEPTEILLAVDRSVTGAVLAGVLGSVRTAGSTQVQLAVGISGHDVRAVPLRVASETPAPGKPSVVDLVVTVTAHEVIVFSRSGREGTARAPRLQIPSKPSADMVAAVQTSLREIVDRRWPAGDRAGADLGIVVLGAGSTTVQTFADLVTAVRASPDGTPLFPEVVIEDAR